MNRYSLSFWFIFFAPRYTRKLPLLVLFIYFTEWQQKLSMLSQIPAKCHVIHIGVGCVMLGQTPQQGGRWVNNELAVSGPAVGLSKINLILCQVGLCHTGWLGYDWWNCTKSIYCIYVHFIVNTIPQSNILPAAPPYLMCCDVSLQLGQWY